MGRHLRDVPPRVATERAVRNAILAALAADLVALVSGRVPWPSILVMIVCVSYLVEAADKWRVTRAQAEEAELHALLDEEDSRLQAVA